jgi:hypothetical protein
MYQRTDTTTLSGSGANQYTYGLVDFLSDVDYTVWQLERAAFSFDLSGYASYTGHLHIIGVIQRYNATGNTPPSEVLTAGEIARGSLLVDSGSDTLSQRIVLPSYFDCEHGVNNETSLKGFRWLINADMPSTVNIPFNVITMWSRRTAKQPEYCDMTNREITGMI